MAETAEATGTEETEVMTEAADMTETGDGIRNAQMS